ncbi:MAG: FAD-binding protein, partial [Planctomycetota bacterium]
FVETQLDSDRVTAWAGAELGKLVLDCVRKGLSGLEALTGIPGSVGGAVKMNARGNFGDIGAAVQTVTLMDKEGNIFEKSKPELVFDYRRTNVTAKFILNAALALNSADPEQIMRTVNGRCFGRQSRPQGSADWRSGSQRETRKFHNRPGRMHEPGRYETHRRHKRKGQGAVWHRAGTGNRNLELRSKRNWQQSIAG